MNNRDYKQFVAGDYYHIYNRGNGRMNIYKDSQDYSNFLKRLRLAMGLEDTTQKTLLRIVPLPKDSFTIICYCLMPNHFHFLIRQNKDIPISMLINKVCSSYSKYFNKKYEHVGHLWQDQFKAVNIDNDEYLQWLSAYIHQNPKVAGLVDDLKDYKWSSYLEYIDKAERILCEGKIIVDKFKNSSDYTSFVGDSYGLIKDSKNIDKLNIMLD